MAVLGFQRTVDIGRLTSDLGQAARRFRQQEEGDAARLRIGEHGDVVFQTEALDGAEIGDRADDDLVARLKGEGRDQNAQRRRAGWRANGRGREGRVQCAAVAFFERNFAKRLVKMSALSAFTPPLEHMFQILSEPGAGIAGLAAGVRCAKWAQFC